MRFPQLRSELADAAIDCLSVNWGDEEQRIVLKIRLPAGDEGDEVISRLYEVLESVFEDSEPQTINDDVIGTLYWDEDRGKWANDIAIAPDLEFQLELDPQEGNVEPLIERTRLWIRNAPELERSLRETAARSELLDLYNSTWCTGSPLALEEFVSKLTLSLAVFSEDGATLYFDDGGLFLEHAVTIRIDADGNFLEACIEG